MSNLRAIGYKVLLSKQAENNSYHRVPATCGKADEYLATSIDYVRSEQVTPIEALNTYHEEVKELREALRANLVDAELEILALKYLVDCFQDEVKDVLFSIATDIRNLVTDGKDLDTEYLDAIVLSRLNTNTSKLTRLIDKLYEDTNHND